MLRYGLIWLWLYTQKVAVVLSGGGARGMAHIGVLQALEENHIPIDYILGTSAGAMVGGYYAAGYTPAQMQKFALSENRRWLAPGSFLQEYTYFSPTSPEAITSIEIPLYIFRSRLLKLPQAVVSDFEINLGLNEHLAGIDAVAYHNFDSLLVPYRAIGADLFRRKPVIFRSGSLPIAVRTSISVPVFFAPVSTKTFSNLVDGGVYDNFPVEVAEKEFKPDFIIGVHVGGAPMTQKEFEEGGYYYSLFSHLIDNRSWQRLPPERSFFIAPDLEDMSSTDFSQQKVLFAIERGYQAAISCIEELKALLPMRADSVKLMQKRLRLQKARPPWQFAEIDFYPASKGEKFFYAQVTGIPLHAPISYASFRKGLLRLRSYQNIISLLPELIYDTLQKGYRATIYVRRAGNFRLRSGATFYSPSDYSVGLEVLAEGAYYVGLRGKAQFLQGSFARRFSLETDLLPPWKLPIFLQVGLQTTQMDYNLTGRYVLSRRYPAPLRTTFQTTELKIPLLLSRFTEASAGVQWKNIENEWTQGDSTQKDLWKGNVFFLRLYQNSLNARQYPTRGQFFGLQASFFQGRNFYAPTQSETPAQQFVLLWPQAKIEWQGYIPLVPQVSLGGRVEGALSLQPTRTTVWATQVSTPRFDPFPESPTLFLPYLYHHAYGAAGGSLITQLGKLQLRMDALWLQPFSTIKTQNDGTLTVSFFTSYLRLPRGYRFLSAGFSYSTFLGPIGAFLNFYEGLSYPWRIYLHFGYLLFPKRPYN
ncbi:MAG: patatin-like phospholipase family protein [Bacteroidia bacterium]